MARPGTCECAAAAEAAEQGGGRGVGLVGDIDTYIEQAKRCEVLVQIFGVLTRLSRTKNTNAIASQYVYDNLLPASP